MGVTDETGFSNVQVLAIVAIVEKAMLGETPIWFDAINHNAGFNHDLGVDATVGLGDKGFVRRQQGKIYSDLCYVQDVGACQEAFPLIKCIICSRRNGSATVDLCCAKR